MQVVRTVAVDLAVDVAQHEDDAGRVALHHGIDAARKPVDVWVVAVVAHQVHAELVEAQVGDGHAARNVFQVHDLVAHLLELLAAVLQVPRLVGVDVVVVAGGRHNGDAHALLDARLELDVLVELHVGPVVHQLDVGVLRADAVHAAEALHDAHGVPVDVVVHQVVAVLEVLALRDAVGGDNDVHVAAEKLRRHHVALLRRGREAGEHLLHMRGHGLYRAGAAVSGNLCARKAELARRKFRDVLIEVVGGVRERGEHEHLTIAWVDGALYLLANLLAQFDDVHVRLDIALPAHPVHILDEDLRGAAHLEAALVVGVEVEPARQVAVGHTGPSR